MSGKLQGFDSFVESAMKDWKVPGLALAIVEGGQAIHCRGYGLRDPSKSLPMTADTRYPLASNTKAFTSMAVGILVDEGKLAWDAPVRRYIPELRMHDPCVTERLTLRDLLCHRSGLPAHDAARFGARIDRRGFVPRFAFLEPSCDMRTKLQYNNLMFMLAGHVVERVAGMDYEQFVAERILQPLGMVKSGFSHSQALRTGEFAQCYWQKDGELKPYRRDREPDAEEVNPGSPAGGLVSTTTDMVPWVVVHLNGGACNGKRIVSEAALAEMHTPQMIDNWPCPFPELGHSSAGLGWFIWTYRGFRLVLHGGFFGSQIVTLPARRIGVVFLPTLGMYSNLWQDVCFTVFDRLLDLPPLPWHERLMDDMAKQVEKEKQDREKAKHSPTPGTQPSHALSDFCGTFENPGYGRLSIVADGSCLHLEPGNDEKIPLRHYHYDSFEVLSEEGDVMVTLTFHLDARGAISGFSAPMEPAVRDIVFIRVAP